MAVSCILNEVGVVRDKIVDYLEKGGRVIEAVV